MIPQDELTAIRAEGLRWMTSTVRVDRPGSGSGTFDPDTGTWTPRSTPTVYTGVAHLHTVSGLREEDVAAAEVRYTDIHARLPFGTDITDDDLVTVLTSPDGQIVDETFRVKQVLVDNPSAFIRAILEVRE